MSSEYDAPTFDPLLTGAVTTPPGSATPSGARSSTRRFEPGSIIAGRYRLVAMLGRGGMGEVYRADDLTLDQPVALKFLPLSVGADERSLARFHNELRIARQVSHRNVCRLYDVGEADGHRFLTMEYIDGEDLGSLLRRIGRLPQDKAVQIARQLCAGVAAAHERGVLHRDLKPANVMLDGNGDARITDFGIATAAADTGDELVGTPHYMAPELFAGQPASVQSDVYALGLTLYELFTGRRAYESDTVAGLRRQHETGTVVTPTSVVRDLDPAVERVILRCLEKDPSKRPASALGAAAMLPGADALADALAAGETPSPELLAAAGEREAFPVWQGLGAVVLVVAGVLAFAALSGKYSIFGRTPHELPPEVLADRAKAIVRAAGYSDVPADEAYAVAFANDGYLNWLRNNNPRPDRFDVLANGRPSAINFWYRSSPRELVTLQGEEPTPSDPPLELTNMRFVRLDTGGRLLDFRSVPLQRDDAPEVDAPAADWLPMFRAADLDPAAFTEVAPQWTPHTYADARVAWEGPLPGIDGQRLRIEGGSYRGRPVAFSLIAPWTQPTLMVERRTEPIDRIFLMIAGVLLSTVAAAAVVLARRNVREDRADRRGAARVAAAVGAAMLLSWIALALYAGITTISAHFRAAGQAALFGLLVWMFYLALEPYARRFWPHSLLGWSRLLAGHVRDPRVGRDVLIGVVIGTGLAMSDILRSAIAAALGLRAPMPLTGEGLGTLLGVGPLLVNWFGWLFSALLGGLLILLGMVLGRLLLRRAWLVIVVASLVLMWTAVNYLFTTSLWFLAIPVGVGIAVALTTVWFGLLTLVVSRFVWYALNQVPMTGDMSDWAAMPSNWTIALLVGLACFGYYASRAGQPLFGRLLDDRT